VAVIALNPTTSVNAPRSDGFTNTIAKNPNIKIVANISGGQTLEGGFKAAQAILSANPKVAAIYTLNDSMAAGAQQAIQQAGRNPMSDPILVGFNGDKVALDLMKEKKLAADVAQSPYQQGIIAVDICWKLLNGETPTYSDAKTKTVNVPVELLTPETLK
jgi:ribose transport system substrate-binding protein